MTSLRMFEIGRQVACERLPNLDGARRVAGLSLAEAEIELRHHLGGVLGGRLLEGGARRGRDDALGVHHEHLAVGREHVGTAAGERDHAMVGVRALLPLAELRQRARQQQPFLGVLRVLFENCLEPNRGGGEVGVAGRILGDRGLGLGGARRERLIRHARRTEREIDQGRPRGYAEGQNDDREGADDRGRHGGVHPVIGGEQSALDLEPRGRCLLRADEAARDITLELLELGAVDGAIVGGARRPRPGRADQRHNDARHHGQRRGDQRDREQHQVRAVAAAPRSGPSLSSHVSVRVGIVMRLSRQGNDRPYGAVRPAPHYTRYGRRR